MNIIFHFVLLILYSIIFIINRYFINTFKLIVDINFSSVIEFKNKSMQEIIYLHGILSFLKCMYLKYELIDCNLF